MRKVEKTRRLHTGYRENRFKNTEQTLEKTKKHEVKERAEGRKKKQGC